MNLAFFEKIGLFLALIEHSCTGNTGYKTEPQFFVTSTRGVSSVPFPFRFPFQLHCELVSSLLALDATELAPQPLTQMVVEMIYIHVISVQQKR